MSSTFPSQPPSLPQGETRPLSYEQKLELLRISSLFVHVPVDLLAEIALHARERWFPQGTYVYVPRDEAKELYLLVDGRIGYPEVQVRDTSSIAARSVATAGQVFGIGAVLPGRPARIISARCERDSVVLAIDGAWMNEVCGRQGHDGRMLIEQLARVYAGYEHVALGRPGWISVRDIGKALPRGRRVLNHCSLELRTGEFCAIYGLRGSGKTTLARIIAGIDRPTDGAVYLDGELVNRRGPSIGFAPDVALISGQSTASKLRNRILRHRRGAETAADLKVASHRLQQVLEEWGVDKPNPDELQRRAKELVQAFLGEARAVVMDEPFRDLTASERKRLNSLCLGLWQSTPRTVLLMTDDVDEAIYLADRVVPLHSALGNLGAELRIDLPRPRSRSDAGTIEWRRIAEEVQQPDGGPTETTVEPALHLATIAVAEPVPVPAPAAANEVRGALTEGRFFRTVEFIPSVDKVLRDDLRKLGGIAERMARDGTLAGFSVTDRVHSDRDPNPVAAAVHLRDETGKQPIVHLSGKDREIGDLRAAIAYMSESGLENVLIVSGDRLKHEPHDRRPRYLESVCAIREARRLRSDLLIATALCPFKYREEDGMGQYLKLGKKVAAGADLVVTQLGWDVRKYEEAMYWVNSRGYKVPIVANLMPMSAPRARYIRGHQLAGVTITDSFLALLEAEERFFPDKGAGRSLRRLALQIQGVRLLGYAGIQLTGIHSVERLVALERDLEVVEDVCSDRLSWSKAWDEVFTLPDGGRADPAPGGDPWYLAERRRRTEASDTARYRVMKKIHNVCFEDRTPARVFGAVCLWADHYGGLPGRALFHLERAVKAPVGCESCGMCRLAMTQYICPETCPKGLANGSCGGTTENLCEFRDRECIHSRKYRIARDNDLLDQLETWLIPPVPSAVRGRASWPAHFHGREQDVEIIDPRAAARSLHAQHRAGVNGGERWA